MRNLAQAAPQPQPCQSSAGVELPVAQPLPPNPFYSQPYPTTALPVATPHATPAANPFYPAGGGSGGGLYPSLDTDSARSAEDDRNLKI